MSDDMTNDGIENVGGAHVGPGQMLKAAREQMKLSKGDVAKQLKLSLQTVMDIEADDYSHIKSMVFIRGYVRAYAKCVGVGIDAVLDALDRLKLEVKQPIKISQQPSQIGLNYQQHRRQQAKATKFAIYAVATLVIVLVGFWWKSIATKSDQQTNMVTVSNSKAAPSVAKSPLNHIQITTSTQPVKTED